MYLGTNDQHLTEPALQRDVHQLHLDKNGPGIRYVAWPPHDEYVARYLQKIVLPTAQVPPQQNQNVVFVGQLPTLLPMQYLAWAIDTLLKEYAVLWVLQKQKNGMAKVCLKTEDQRDRLVALSKYMLFDICGVWIAETKEQFDHFCEYTQAIRNGDIFINDSRVPRHGMTVEKLRRDPPGPRSSRKPFDAQKAQFDKDATAEAKRVQMFLAGNGSAVGFQQPPSMPQVHISPLITGMNYLPFAAPPTAEPAGNAPLTNMRNTQAGLSSGSAMNPLPNPPLGSHFYYNSPFEYGLQS